MAMLVAFACLFPEHLVFFYGLLPLKAKIFALLLLAFVAVGSLLGQAWLEMATQLGGAAAALLFVTRRRPRRKRAATRKREPSRPELARHQRRQARREALPQLSSPIER